MWVQFVSPFYRERNPGTKKSQGSKSHAGTQGTTGKLALPDFRVTAFNVHVTEATREIIKVRPVLKDFIWLLMAILCSPPTAPWAHHSCNDAGPTGEERDAWRSQAPHPGPAAGHSADCSRVQGSWTLGGTSKFLQNTLKMFCLFVCFSLFNLCGRFHEQQCFSRRSRNGTTTKNQTHKKYISATKTPGWT